MYRVPIRTPELKLRCLITCNPLANVNWMFLPSNYSDEQLQENPHWIGLNSQAIFSMKTFTRFDEDDGINSNEGDFIYTLPLSKYQIYEKHFNGKYIDSVLAIKVGSFCIF